jgi:signal transduction histidine kinase
LQLFVPLECFQFKTTISLKIKYLICSALLLFTFSSISALEVIDSLKSVLNTANNPEQKTELLLLIGNEYITKNHDSAQLYIDIAAIQLMENPSVTNSANYYKVKGLFLNKDFKNEEAVSHLKTSRNLYNDLNSSIDIALVDNLIGNCFNDMEMHDSSIYYFNKSAENIDSITNPSLLATNYNNVANVLDKLGNKKKALNYYLKALPLFEELNNMESFAITTNNVGIIFMALEQYEKAIDYFKKAALINTNVGNEFNLCSNYNSLGMTYMELNKYDSAAYFTSRANIIAEESNYEYLQAQSSHNLGAIYIELGDYNNAEKYLNHSLSLCYKLDIKKGIVFNLISLGTVYSKLSKFELADKQLLTGLKLCRESNFISHYDEIYDALTANYKAWGKYREALNYYQKYVIVKDSIDDLLMEQELNEIQTKYETEQKELENQRLKNENKLQNMVISRQKLTVTVTILIAAIAILCLILVIAIRIKRKKRIAMLEAKNKLIREKSDQLILSNQTKDKLFSIIAHDLRSPFTSLLGFSSLIKQEAESGNLENVLLFSKQLNTVTKSTFELLDNLLSWSRSQQDTIISNPKVINLHECVIDIVLGIKEKAEEKEITINQTVEETYYITTDINMLKVVLRNLLSNALKFTPRGGNIIINCNEEPTKFVISVVDTGLGMEPELSSNLFTNKPVKSTKGTDNELGSGLGLMLVKDFVTRMEGRIWVTSEPLKGSSFSFTIPKK